MKISCIFYTFLQNKQCFENYVIKNVLTNSDHKHFTIAGRSMVAASTVRRREVGITRRDHYKCTIIPKTLTTCAGAEITARRQLKPHIINMLNTKFNAKST